MLCSSKIWGRLSAFKKLGGIAASFSEDEYFSLLIYVLIIELVILEFITAELTELLDVLVFDLAAEKYVSLKNAFSTRLSDLISFLSFSY